MTFELHRRISLKLRGVLFLGVLWILTGVSARSDESVASVPIDRWVLDNGMTFLLVDRPESSTIAAGWVAAVGSADDPRGRTGLSHLLEHMMFKGTGKLGTSELDVLYASAGASGLNAVTQLDTTAFFVAIPPEKLELWFWLESDRLHDPVFREFQVEKKIILEERRLRVESTPTGRFEERLRARLWGDDPYGRPGIGRPEDMEAVELPETLEHFQAHYGAANLTAVLVGPLEAGRIRTLAQRYFGRLSRGPNSSGVPLPKPLGGPSLFEATCDCRPQVRALYRAPSLSSNDGPALDMLVGLLNSRTGRLHRALVLDQAIAFSAYSQYTPLKRGGVLSLVAEAKSGTAPADLLVALDREITLLLTEPPAWREVQKVRNQLRSHAFRRLKEPSELMMELLLQAGMGEVGRLKRWLSAIETVDPSMLQEMARRYLDPGQRIVGFIERSVSAGPRSAAEGERP